jgi:hypothetical protein
MEFAVNQDSPEGRTVGSLWLGRDGIPMRRAGKFEMRNDTLTTIDWELRPVEIGEHDAALFEIRHGFTRLSPEPAIPLLGQSRPFSGQLYAFLKAAKPFGTSNR